MTFFSTPVLGRFFTDPDFYGSDPDSDFWPIRTQKKNLDPGKKNQIRNTDHKCQVIMMMIITVIIVMITVIMMTDDYLPEVGQAVQPYCLGKGAMMRPRRKNDDHNSDNDD